MQQNACVVVNLVTFGNFAFLFNCMPACRTAASIYDGSDLKTYLYMKWLGFHAVVGPNEVLLLDFFCSGIQFY